MDCQAMLDVRPEEPEDFGAVRAVHEQAFAPSQEEADLVDALRATQVHVPELCLLALRGGAVIAHIAFSRARLDSGHPAYYPRFGFESADVLGVAAPFAVPTEAWMVHRLPAYRRDARGTVAYPKLSPA